MSEVQDSSNKEEQQIRQNLVTTAINFLLNPGVIDKPYAHKTAFLKKKGLTDAEISLAYKKVENDPKYNIAVRNDSSSSILPPPIPAYNRPITFWSQLNSFSSSLIVLGVAVFGAHYIYKNYIEPLIFGKEAENGKSLKLEKQLLEMAGSLSQLEKTVSALEENIKLQKTQMDKIFQNEVYEYYPTPVALKDLKTEVGAIKSMLLNRHQFPALPKITPTIPQWQLPATNTDGTTEQNNEENKEQYSDSSNTTAASSPEHPAEDSNDSIEVTGDLFVDTVHEVSEVHSDEDKNMKLNCDLAVS